MMNIAMILIQEVRNHTVYIRIHLLIKLKKNGGKNIVESLGSIKKKKMEIVVYAKIRISLVANVNGIEEEFLLF